MCDTASTYLLCAILIIITTLVDILVVVIDMKISHDTGFAEGQVSASLEHTELLMKQFGGKVTPNEDLHEKSI